MSTDPLEAPLRLCLALPETTERLSHGEPTWFVRGRRTFVTYADHHHDDRLACWCAAPAGAQAVLTATAPERFFVPPYVGYRGWIGVRLDVPVDWDEIAGLVADAYRAVAPRKLVDGLDACARAVLTTSRRVPVPRQARRAAVWPGAREADVDRAHRYLAESALGALNAVNAWEPLTHRSIALGPVALANWLTSEMPLQLMAVEALRAGLAARAGALSTPTGRAGLLLSAATCAGLAAVYRQDRRTADVLDKALTEALGEDYKTRVRHPERPVADAATARHHGVVRMLRVRRHYAHAPDVEYGPAGRRNHLDVWRHADLPPGSRAPVLVQVPGGAWIMGNKQGQAYPLMSHLAEYGWVCVSISYRLSPWSTWPAQIVDVKRALTWVKANIAEYGGDPDFVAITGGSAGGHLCALAALTAEEHAYQPGFEDADTSVVAAVPFYGVYDWTFRRPNPRGELQHIVERLIIKIRAEDDPELFRKASPTYRVHADAPPFFILHGAHDLLAPVAQARLLYAALHAVSTRPVAYAELPVAPHGFDAVGTVRATMTAEAVARFLGVVYGEHVAAQTGPRTGANREQRTG